MCRSKTPRSLHALWAFSALVGVFPSACAAPVDDTHNYSHERERAALLGKADRNNPLPEKEWTVLWFGAGDNDLSNAIAFDANELAAVGSTEYVNLVGFYDGRGREAVHIYFDNPGEWWFKSSHVEIGEVDTGDPETLVAFARWGIEQFPAKRYALIVGGHGTPREIAPDDTGGVMSVADVESAVSRASELAGKRIDVFGADACLMQTFDSAFQLEPYVDVVVASQVPIISAGWPYVSIIEKLNEDPTMDALALGRVITRSWYEWRNGTNLGISASEAGDVNYLSTAAIAGGSSFTRELLSLAETAADEVRARPAFFQARFEEDAWSGRYGFANLARALQIYAGVFDGTSLAQRFNTLSVEAPNTAVYFPARPPMLEAFEDYRASCRFCESSWTDLLFELHQPTADTN